MSGSGWAADEGASGHCFVADLDDPAPSDPDAHHLGRVLRLRPGEAVTAADGAGRWRRCVVASGRPLRLEPDGPVRWEPIPQPALTVAFAPTKGDRPEWAVQKLTELGVDRIGILQADRSVVRWTGDRAEAQLARLAAVAREAGVQCRRARLPEVGPLVTVPEALGAWVGAALCDRDGTEGPSLERPALLVGPEGGWSPQERAAAGPPVRLGPGLLRGETAAVAAATLLVALRGGTVRPPGSRRPEVIEGERGRGN